MIYNNRPCQIFPKNSISILLCLLKYICESGFTNITNLDYLIILQYYKLIILQIKIISKF